MDKFLRQSWWKFLSIALLLFAIVGGVLLPLGPRIIQVNVSADAIEVVGMNTHFGEEEASLQVWLRDKENALICVDEFEIIDNKTLKVSNQNVFQFEEEVASNFLDLVVNNNIDGNLILINSVLKSEINYQINPNVVCSNEVENAKSDLLSFPNREVLFESVRNLLYHVPMWFAMVFLLLLSFIYSIRYLSKPSIELDNYASNFANVGVLFGMLGIVTGMVWARSTWGAFWTNDPKLNGAAIGMLIYFAYLILRASIDDEMKRGKLAATYNIFAFIMYITFIFVIPRLTDSLHPGNGGNPAFSSYDLDNTLRIFFYPASIGWILLGIWISSLLIRINRISQQIEDIYE